MATSIIKSDMEYLNIFTPATGTIKLYAQFSLTDGVITFNLDLFNESYVANTEFLVGTIPIEYAPRYQVFFTGLSANEPLAVQDFILSVKPNGQITISRIGNTNGRYLICNGAYALHSS